MSAEALKDRIERMRSGGLDGPSPTGFLMSVSESGSVMIVTHDLGLADGAEISVSTGEGYVRLFCNGHVILQTIDTETDTRETLNAANKLTVLEMNGPSPLRLHSARLC
jgi:hypothetical protein